MPSQGRLKTPSQEALTCIHQRIHCAATPNPLEEPDELDQIAINHFLDTLVEVAMAIASRNIAQGQKDE